MTRVRVSVEAGGYGNVEVDLDDDFSHYDEVTTVRAIDALLARACERVRAAYRSAPTGTGVAGVRG